MVGTDTIGSWEGRKEKLRILYPFLTDEDLRLEASNRIVMFRNLKEKLGKATDQELHQLIISL